MNPSTASDSWRQIVLENALDAVIGVDFDDRVVDWNRQAETTFGWRKDEALGKQMSSLIVPEEYRSRHSAGMKRFRETGIGPILNKRIEIIALHRNGNVFPVELTVVPIPVDGSYLFYSFLRDISDRKRVERERLDAKEAAERAARSADHLNQLKDDFLASLSHEIRTPLNAIAGFTELLGLDLADRMDPHVKESIDAITRNTASLTRMISDLLDVSKIVSGKIAFEPAQTPIKDVTDLIVANSRQAAKDKGLHFVTDFIHAPLRLHVDSTRMQQILWNLVSNAMKFTPRGGTVRLRIAEDGEDCVVEVSDTGIGIDAAFLPHVFDRFRQENSSITRTHGGLGLGLAITRHLVELHGGTISVTSGGKGQGTHFIVRLPILAPHVPQESTEDSDAHRIQGRSIESLKVLVVDDSPDSLRLMIRMLESMHSRVSSADSVSNALDKIEREPPDVVISDIGMPGESGFDLIARIRNSQSEKVRNVRAIALTAYARPEERQKILEAGFDAHLAKPVNLASLSSAIARGT